MANTMKAVKAAENLAKDIPFALDGWIPVKHSLCEGDLTALSPLSISSENSKASEHFNGFTLQEGLSATVWMNHSRAHDAGIKGIKSL